MGIKGENVLDSAQREAGKKKEGNRKDDASQKVYACQCNDLKGKDK